MKTAFTFLVLCLVSSSLGNPYDNALLLRQRRDVDIIENSRLLVEELIKNLRSAAEQAMEAVTKFISGIQEQGKLVQEKITNDIKDFRQNVRNAIKNVTDRFTDAGSGVRACIESHNNDTEQIFGDTAEKAKQCTENHINEVGTLVENLKVLAGNATDYTNNAIAELKNCTDNGQGFFSTGTCLGGIAMRTEFRGAMFVTQSGLLIARINLALSTLPAALEVCAGTHLVEAGINSAKIVVNIGTCSASSIYYSFTGNDSE